LTERLSFVSYWRQTTDPRKRWIEMTSVFMPTPGVFTGKDNPNQYHQCDQNGCANND
jgi:hypothetical protein